MKHSKNKSTFREETIAKEFFAEFIFCDLQPQSQKFLPQNFSKLVNRKNFFRKTFLNSVNRKNFFCKNIQDWSITKINSAFFFKKKKKTNNFGQIKDIEISLQKMIG